MNNRSFKFTAEAYYKALGNLVPYSVNNVKVVYYGSNESSGHAAGIDLKLYGEFVPGTDSWLSLSLMNTSMKLNGKSIPLPTDQRDTPSTCSSQTISLEQTDGRCRLNLLLLTVCHSRHRIRNWNRTYSVLLLTRERTSD